MIKVVDGEGKVLMEVKDPEPAVDYSSQVGPYQRAEFPYWRAEVPTGRGEGLTYARLNEAMGRVGRNEAIATAQPTMPRMTWQEAYDRLCERPAFIQVTGITLAALERQGLNEFNHDGNMERSFVAVPLRHGGGYRITDENTIIVPDPNNHPTARVHAFQYDGMRYAIQRVEGTDIYNFFRWDEGTQCPIIDEMGNDFYPNIGHFINSFEQREMIERRANADDDWYQRRAEDINRWVTLGTMTGAEAARRLDGLRIEMRARRVREEERRPWWGVDANDGPLLAQTNPNDAYTATYHTNYTFPELQPRYLGVLTDIGGTIGGEIAENERWGPRPLGPPLGATTPYTATVVATGGTVGGLGIGPTGVITGSPATTVAGPYEFTIRVTDEPEGEGEPES